MLVTYIECVQEGRGMHWGYLLVNVITDKVTGWGKILSEILVVCASMLFSGIIY